MARVEGAVALVRQGAQPEERTMSHPVRRAFAVTIGFASLALGVPRAAAAFDSAAAFGSRCSGCHSVGRGDVVGPDLKGVLQRHDRSWLHLFIHSSQSVIREGDRAALALYERYGRRTMPDHDLSVTEIDALLDWIAAGGPAGAGSAAARRASAASPAEIRLGRELFSGRRPFANGGAACADCHGAADVNPWGGGALGGDLTHVYDKYQDWGMGRALADGDFPLMASIYHRQPLTVGEVFAVKAFLYQASRTPLPPSHTSSPLFLMLGLGSSALVIGLKGRGPKGP
jgi:mono/diheme cytochrome c family protein